MRKELVDCKTRYMAKKLCPWSSVIAEVDGGYYCFESVDDYNIWKAQK